MPERRLDFNEISGVYDDVREADAGLIDHMLARLPRSAGLTVLEIGCGTANHTDALQRKVGGHGWRVCGLDPAERMLARARQKNAALDLRLGTGEEIPWQAETFDFIYMTAVIHHVRDVVRMFTEIRRVLKPGAQVCIATQSHEQVARRPLARFFPATTEVDYGRYPPIDEIIRKAEVCGLTHRLTEVLYDDEDVQIDERDLELVRKKGFSRFRLISDRDYDDGLRALEWALRDGPIGAKYPGETLIWFHRNLGDVTQPGQSV